MAELPPNDPAGEGPPLNLHSRRDPPRAASLTLCLLGVASMALAIGKDGTAAGFFALSTGWGRTARGFQVQGEGRLANQAVHTKWRLRQDAHAYSAPSFIVWLGAMLGLSVASRRRPSFILRRSQASQRNATVRLRAQMQSSLPDAGIAVIERTDRKRQMKEQFDKEKWWRVLLHNDDIHTFEYVTGCLVRVVKHLTRRKAYNVTWEAHSSGKATVACVWKPLAEQFCVNLQQLGLTVSVAPDSKFEGNKGGG